MLNREPGKTRKTLGGWTNLLVVVVLLFVSGVLLRPLAMAPATRLYDASSFTGAFLNQPDVMLNAWILAWGSHALAQGRVRHFFDANIFYPEADTLALSEHMVGVLPFFAPLYLLTRKLALSLNLWTIFTFVACGFSMYWVTFRWLQSHLAAAIASVVFAFAPWRFAELTHVQVLSVQYLPWIAYGLWATRERRDVGLWLLLFAGLALQVSSSYYLGYLAFTLVSIGMVVLIVSQPEARGARIVFVGSVLLAVALLMLPLSLPYLDLGQSGRLGAKIGVDQGFSAWSLIQNFIFPLFPNLGFRDWHAWLILPVVAAIGTIMGVVSRPTRHLTVFWVVVGLAGMVLSMTPGHHFWGVPIGWIDGLLSTLVPGWKALRVMNRFGILLWMALSFLAAVPFACGKHKPGWVHWGVRGAGAGLIGALLLSTATLDLHTRPAPEFVVDREPYLWLAANGEGDPVLEWPMEGGSQHTSRYMYLSTLHWLPLVNGYSGYIPASNRMIRGLAGSLPRAGAVHSLIAINVTRWVLVHHPLPARPAIRRSWAGLTRVGAKLRLEGPAFQIWELPFDSAKVSPIVLGERAGHSIFGVAKVPLVASQLSARITPFRRHLVDRLRLGLPSDWRIRNLSSVRWPAIGLEEQGLVGLVFRVRRAAESESEDLRGFNRLPLDLGPGEVAGLRARVFSPRETGRYTLVPCLAQAGGPVRRCFEESAVTLDVTNVRSRPPSNTVGAR